MIHFMEIEKIDCLCEGSDTNWFLTHNGDIVCICDEYVEVLTKNRAYKLTPKPHLSSVYCVYEHGDYLYIVDENGFYIYTIFDGRLVEEYNFKVKDCVVVDINNIPHLIIKTYNIVYREFIVIDCETTQWYKIPCPDYTIVCDVIDTKIYFVTYKRSGIEPPVFGTHVLELYVYDLQTGEMHHRGIFYHEVDRLSVDITDLFIIVTTNDDILEIYDHNLMLKCELKVSGYSNIYPYKTTADYLIVGMYDIYKEELYVIDLHHNTLRKLELSCEYDSIFKITEKDNRLYLFGQGNNIQTLIVIDLTTLNVKEYPIAYYTASNYAFRVDNDAIVFLYDGVLVAVDFDGNIIDEMDVGCRGLMGVDVILTNSCIFYHLNGMWYKAEYGVDNAI